LLQSVPARYARSPAASSSSRPGPVSQLREQLVRHVCAQLSWAGTSAQLVEAGEPSRHHRWGTKFHLASHHPAPPIAGRRASMGKALPTSSCPPITPPANTTPARPAPRRTVPALKRSDYPLPERMRSSCFLSARSRRGTHRSEKGIACSGRARAPRPIRLEPFSTSTPL
jgi:hypothetical protein